MTSRTAMVQSSVALSDFEAAAKRIRGRVRRTPLLDVDPVMERPGGAQSLHLKLECLQPTGSFKVRGASNTAAMLSEAERGRGLITASGGNHGLGVAYAARDAGVPAIVFVPASTPEKKREAIRALGADVIVEGEVWDDANAAALSRAEADGMTYIHPFADSRVIAGQGTIALEILAAEPDVDTLVVAIGGGGLIAGVATAAKLLKPGIRVIGVEPVGAPTHLESRRAGKVITLDRIETAAGTLAPRRSDALNVGLITRSVDEIVLVSDDAMRLAAQWLWRECGIAAELSGAASVAALAEGLVPDAGMVSAIVCGAGTDGIGQG